MRRPPPRIGFRREVAIVLPATVLMLVVLSVFSALAFRQGIERIVEERRTEALRSARPAAEALTGGPPPTAAGLARLLPGAAAGALVSLDGRVIAATGDLGDGPPLALLGGRAPDLPRAFGPGATVPQRIVVLVPLVRGGRTLILRVDREEGTLARQLATSRLLTRVVIALGLAVAVFGLVFLRYLLTPYDRLLARARDLRPEEAPTGEGMDEITFLVESFERAVSALERRSEEDDLAEVGRALVASLESGLLLVDRRGQLLAFNHRAREILGVADSDIGRDAGEALRRHEALARTIRGAAAGDEPVLRQEIRIDDAEGERTLGVSIHPLRRDDGGVRGHIVLFADLTDAHRRAVEERLTDSLAQLGGMAAGIAHELRNSLATLRGYLTLVERRPAEGSVTDYLEELKRESDHLQRVLDDFLTFARPESRRVEPVDLRRLLDRAVADPAFGPGAVRVVPWAGPPPALLGDPQLLERAIRNLLANAVAARAAGSDEAVEVSVDQVTGSVTVTIADRGDGVPAGVRERLFQPFVTGRPDGVGLGLALSHRILSLHGGQLRLEDRPGGGTLAIVVLPTDRSDTIRNKSAEAAHPPPAERPPAGSL